MRVQLNSQVKPALSAMPFLFLLLLIFVPLPCFANVESSLSQIKGELTGVILPTVSVIGMTFAAISFFTGNPQSKQHIIYAILGCIFGFGAQAIVDLLSGLVR